MKSSAVCLREVGTERVENMGESINSSTISPETHGYTHTCSLLSLILFVFLPESHPSLAREELRETVLGDMS